MGESGSMEFHSLAPGGPVVMTPKLHGDERGFFMETFRQNDFVRHCGEHNFVQDNQSRSRGRVLRGLHYQLTQPQGKLVRVISGRVFDVAVDLRRSSAFFGKSYALLLDAAEHKMFWVPPGFAHGFLVLGDSAEFVYKCTAYYAPEDECCLKWDDPVLGIDWPLPEGGPILSEKDAKGRPLADCQTFA